MKKVLIALDYDPSAKKIAEIGVKMAKAMGVHVTLMHVISPSLHYSSMEYSPILGFTGYVDMSPLQMDSVDELKKASLLYLDKIKHHFSDTSIHTMVVEGEVADAIMKTADEIHADIIVVGSHSRRWLDEILMGSVAEKVLHHTTVPLFIIPTKKQ